MIVIQTPSGECRSPDVDAGQRRSTSRPQLAAGRRGSIPEDRETALRDAMQKQPKPQHFNEDHVPIGNAISRPIVCEEIGPKPRLSAEGWKVRPLCIGAAFRNSFELTSAAHGSDNVLKAAFAELPLAENGWQPRLTRIDRIGDSRWRLTRYPRIGDGG